ncbi:hypothetical protein [Mongoliitalea lutea]|uniref:Outer membrane protein beta-barrel domain-containing protein n=1 Tax=Mongoliitalea lutea TaxID=849756 RepID=A0A8J3G4E2_9BACT|nr:hypothetical protein [Mongoliitalea lutea]GHB30339.1 hypothetical protein GCM10008106_09030 [Mongoliitalea lutea]
MKKLVIICLIFGVVAIAQAQEQGDFRVQLGGEYKLQIQDFGANAGVEYFFADKFALAPNFTYWFPQVGRSMNFNMDLRYYLTEGVSQVYVLGGYSNYWINLQPGIPGLNQTRPGGNFGLGAMIALVDGIGLNTEFKVQSQNTRQPVLRVGLVFGL